MNILLVTYSFPPAAGVGVLRAFSLAKYLPQNGINVHVLTARNAAAVGQDDRPLATLPPTVDVHRTWTPDLPFTLRKSLKKLISRSAKGSKQESSSGYMAGSRGKYNLIKKLFADLLLPDPQVGWVPFAFRTAHQLLSSGGIDLVLITVPPFSAARLATKLRQQHPELPIVLDFRDEWISSTLKFVSFNSNERALQVARKTENEAVHAATAVVCVTERAVEELRSRYPEERPQKFYCVPNGFDREISDLPELKSKIKAIEAAASRQVIITYLGSIYGSTDPHTVVEAVMQLPSAIKGRVHFRFIGHIEDERHRQQLLQLGDNAELIDFLPQEEALKHLENTTYLLLITHDAINVSAKLYDYLGSGIPILAAVNPRGDAYRIVTETNAGWTADSNDQIALMRMFEEAVERAPNLSSSFSPNLEKISGFHRARLAERYATLLRLVAHTKS